MTKRYFVTAATVALLLAALPLRAFASSSTTGPIFGTLVLRGTMSSVTTLTMTGALSLGHATNLSWDLPRPTSMQLDGYQELVRSLAYEFNVRPTSFTDLSVGGQQVRQFHWTAPPAHTVIRVVERVKLTVISALSPFESTAPYPLRPSAAVAAYLRVTSATRLPQAARWAVRELASGTKTERGVVARVADYVASHVRYSQSPAVPFDARWVFAHHQATCRGYANLMAGMLRALGIPTQVEFGWVSSAPISLPGPGHSAGMVRWATGSAGEGHVWLNVYFPGSGWVPFDPQREKFFVDPRHIGLFPHVDAGSTSIGAWSAQSPPGQSPMGRDLGSGSPEIVPGDGVASKVTVQSRDHFHLAYRQINRDVKGILLISR